MRPRLFYSLSHSGSNIAVVKLEVNTNSIRANDNYRTAQPVLLLSFTILTVSVPGTLFN